MPKVTWLGGGTRKSLTHAHTCIGPGTRTAVGKAGDNDNHYMWSWSLVSAKTGGDAETPPWTNAGAGSRNACWLKALLGPTTW